MHQIVAKKIATKNKTLKFNHRKKLHHPRSAQIPRKTRRRISRYIAIAAAFSDSMPVRIDEVLYAWNVIMCRPYVLTCFNSCVGI